MSGPLGSSQWMYASGGFYPYNIGQSLRFNDNDSAYLSWTPASAGDRKTWTWSGWVKRANLGSAQTLLGANTTFVEFTSADKIQFDHNGTTVATSAVFRDPSAWYHVVVAVDTTQATAADRTEIYVNGTIQAVTGSYVSQNTDTDVNDATQHNIGANLTPAEYLDGYMAEIKFIDGTALDPTSFGETKSGIWVPKAYSGSYGTNGFYLNFSDSSAIGDDLSGNANDWTTSGLASTDVVLDSPTNNYAVLNPLDKNASFVLSDGNLAFQASTTAAQGARSTFAIPSGVKVYAECSFPTWTTGTNNYAQFGIATSTASMSSDIGNTAGTGFSIEANQLVNTQLRLNGSSVSVVGAVASNDVFQIAVDLDNLKVWLGKNNTWYDSSGGTTGDPATGANATGTLSSGIVYFPAALKYGTANSHIVNFGQAPFAYTPPSGFVELNTANLPDPAIDPAQDDVPADYFNTVLYTGTGAALSITGVGFQPDWTWIKGRSGATDHALYDAVRGVQEQLESNQTGAETTEATGLTAFGADGFSVGALAQLNTSTATYVAWNWLAGNGTSSNTDGTITSTVSVNQKAGFSIVSYTGTGANATVGHGLGAVPSMMIVKNRDQADAWQVYHGANTANPETDYLVLNTTAVTADASDRWNDTLPTTAVFSIGTGVTVNTNTENYIAYCFAEVEGFSKFGSYTGNGSADGPFIYCGFRPAFVMYKRTNIAASWIVLDAKRSSYNVVDDYLVPNSTAAEASYTLMDFTANGFKLRDNASGNNASGDIIIFMAFAEAPFKYANAR